MSFIEKLIICINKSEYFEWYENNGFKIINYDSRKFIDDLIKYNLTLISILQQKKINIDIN